MRAGFVIAGLIILLGTWFFSNAITAQQQSQLQLAGGACNSVFGTIGSALSSTVAQDCQQVNEANTLLALVPIAYLFGIIFFFIGLVARPKGQAQPTAQHTQEKAEEPKETKPSEHEAIKTLKIRYAKGEITKKQFDQMKKDLE